MPDEVQSDNIVSRNLIARWGGNDSVFADGFVGVPTVLLTHMGSIGDEGLTPAEAVFALQVMSFKWDDEAPYPSYGRVARQMGVSETYARKLARSLEDKDLLIRRPREGTTNKFDFRPLFMQLAEIGEEIERGAATPLPF